MLMSGSRAADTARNQLRWVLGHLGSSHEVRDQTAVTTVFRAQREAEHDKETAQELVI